MMVCWHRLVLPQESAASQVRVAITVLVPVVLVTVFRTVTVTAPHASVAKGWSKFQDCPTVTVTLDTTVKAGGVVSWTVIICTARAVLPQVSVAVQVRVMMPAEPQRLLTESLKLMLTEPHPS